MVDAIGWLVVMSGIALGGMVLYYVIRQSSGAGVIKRTIMIGLAIIGMGIFSISGLAAAVEFFFLQC